MIIVIAAVAVVGVMMLTMLSAAVDSSKWTDRQVETFQVEAAAETAVAMLASDFWTGFERQTNGLGGLTGFQAYLESRGVEHRPSGQTYAAKSQMDHRESMDMHQDSRGAYLVDGVDVEEMLVHREDSFGTTRLFIECSTSNRTAGKGHDTTSFRVQHVYEIAAAEWEGTEFALLSNNVNCLLCHTSVDNAERYYNDSPTNYNTYDRVRLGSIETFHVREDPVSEIAGSIYLGGDAVLEDGSPITDWSALTLNSAQFDHAGLLLEDPFGGLQFNPMAPASSVSPDPMENLYLDYLSGGVEGQVDGMLPSSFPSPFPDNGGLDLVSGQPTPSTRTTAKLIQTSSQPPLRESMAPSRVEPSLCSKRTGEAGSGQARL